MKRTKSPRRLQPMYEVYSSDDHLDWVRSGGSQSITQAKAVALGWQRLGAYTRVVKVTRAVVATGNPVKPTPKPSTAALVDTPRKAS